VGVHDVVFECDSKIVSDALNSSSEAQTTIANYVLVTHIKRQGNRPAQLAQHTKNISNYVNIDGGKSFIH